MASAFAALLSKAQILIPLCGTQTFEMQISRASS